MSSSTATDTTTYTIDDPSAIVDGKTIAQWTQEWWRWLYPSPSNQNPITDTTGKWATEHNQGPVFFIAGSATYDPANPPPTPERYFTIHQGTPLLVPMINFGATPTPPIGPASLAVIKDRESTAVQQLDQSVNNVYATLDGKQIVDPFKYQENTGFFSLGTVRPHTVASDFYGEPKGANLDPSKAGGYWLMIENLSPGMHTLEFGGSSAGVTNLAGLGLDIPPFADHVIDHIKVV